VAHPQRWWWADRRQADGHADDAADSNRTSAFLNVRVADIKKIYEEWTAKGATFLTEPKVHSAEIRAYVRDPDGHLIEVGQSTRRPA